MPWAENEFLPTSITTPSVGRDFTGKIHMELQLEDMRN